MKLFLNWVIGILLGVFIGYCIFYTDINTESKSEASKMRYYKLSNDVSLYNDNNIQYYKYKTDSDSGFILFLKK